jgi:hypothetical protein
VAVARALNWPMQSLTFRRDGPLLFLLGSGEQKPTAWNQLEELELAEGVERFAPPGGLHFYFEQRSKK